MFLSTLARGFAAAAIFATPTVSFADIVVSESYARVSRPNAPTGAAFLVLENTGSTADRLMGVRSEVAKRVELHTHIDQGDGVMKMSKIEEGIEIPAGTVYTMQRGGDHVMFMGVIDPLVQGEDIEIVLTFEQAGDVTVVIPVDNDRTPEHGAKTHNHGN
ncbi:MAG: copper chaperone PCu(A)C [Roseobacter sp.]